VQNLGDGQKVPLAGGLRMPVGPLVVVYSKNLTPDLAASSRTCAPRSR
jgi:hypothetical protein